MDGLSRKYKRDHVITVIETSEDDKLTLSKTYILNKIGKYINNA